MYSALHLEQQLCHAFIRTSILVHVPMFSCLDIYTMLEIIFRKEIRGFCDTTLLCTLGN